MKRGSEKRGKALRVFLYFSFNTGKGNIGPNIVGSSTLIVRLKLFEIYYFLTNQDQVLKEGNVFVS